MAKAIIEEGQNMMDMAIQHLGDMTGIMSLANANNMSPTGAIVPGNSLELPTIINAGMVAYFKQEEIIPATEPGPGDPVTPGGIGYMKIGFDFRVS